MKPISLNKSTLWRGVVFVLTVVLSGVLLYAANQYVTSQTISFAGENSNEYVKAEVLEILSREDTLSSPTT